MAKKNYFQLKSKGFNKDSQREEMQINCGENGVLYLFKTDEGFKIHLFNQNEEVNSMAVFETDLEPDEEPDEEKVFEDCELIYNTGGSSAVIDHVYKQLSLNNPSYKNVKSGYCEPCDNINMPFLNGVCLVCGTIKHDDIEEMLQDRFDMLNDIEMSQQI